MHVVLSYLIQWENCNSLISLVRSAFLSIHKGKSGRHSSAWLTTSVIVFFNYNKVNSSITPLPICLSSLHSLRIGMLEQNRAGLRLICKPARRSAPAPQCNQYSERPEESRYQTKTYPGPVMVISLGSAPYQSKLLLSLTKPVSKSVGCSTIQKVR